LQGKWQQGRVIDLSSAPQPIKVLSSFRAFESFFKGNSRVQHQYLGEGDSSGNLLSWLRWVRTAVRACYGSDLLVFNVDSQRLLVTCAIFWLIGPRRVRRCRIVSVDLVLRPPFSRFGKLIALLKSVLLQQVDLFILYFRNIDGYVRHFHVPRHKTVYVPFKVNSWEHLLRRRGPPGEGEYVLLAGTSLRDHKTFAAAVGKSGVPAVLLVPREHFDSVRQSSWYQAGIPSNLRVECDTIGTEEAYLGYFERAKVVCLPRFSWDIAPSGISAALCGMALGKCVVISRGPGADDIFSEARAALFFDSENVEDLARTLREVWQSRGLCRRIAENGVRYADSVQGEERLIRDILLAIGLQPSWLAPPCI